MCADNASASPFLYVPFFSAGPPGGCERTRGEPRNSYDSEPPLSRRTRECRRDARCLSRLHGRGRCGYFGLSGGGALPLRRERLTLNPAVVSPILHARNDCLHDDGRRRCRCYGSDAKRGLPVRIRQFNIGSARKTECFRCNAERTACENESPCRNNECPSHRPLHPPREVERAPRAVFYHHAAVLRE